MPRSKAKNEPPSWETTILESVGRVIEFWGFKRNHGRLWALLYLADEPMNATELGERLGLSKGAVSMVVRELQSWAVLRRAPTSSSSGVRYEAERNMWLMISTVLEQRERRLVTQVLESLETAEKDVRKDVRMTPKERRAMAGRIKALQKLARTAQIALDALLRSRKLDLGPLGRVLSLSS